MIYDGNYEIDAVTAELWLSVTVIEAMLRTHVSDLGEIRTYCWTKQKLFG